MKTSFRIFLTLILIVLLGYFGLVWVKFFPHPSFLPEEIEPLTFLVGVAISFLLWIDEFLKLFRSRNAPTITVKILHANLSPSKSPSKNFKSFTFSNIIDIQFHIENFGNRVIAIKDMSVSTIINNESIEFQFARIYKIKPGYPNSVTIDPRPDLIEVIEKDKPKTLKVRIENSDIGRSLKNELTEPLYFKLNFLDGREHIEVFYIEN